MPFDGIIINALVSELKDKLIGGRIDKVHQPEKDELIFHIRNVKSNYKLLVSVESRLAHVTLTDVKKGNPTTPPMFCMLMRKHLAGSKIIDITQLEMERIIKLSVESRNELGDMIVKDLIIEVMGKHSNIVLIEQASNRIIDSVKRIPFGTSRSRQLLPGLTYEYPPLDKLNPLTTTKEDYLARIETLAELDDTLTLSRLILTLFQGISPVISKILCTQSSLDPNRAVTEAVDTDFDTIWQGIEGLKEQIIDRDYKFVNVVDDYGISKDFSIMTLPALMSDEKNEELIFDTVTETINKFYEKKDFNNRNMQKSMNLRKVVSGRITKLNKKLKNLNKDLSAAKNAKEFQVIGDLIIGNIFKIKKGDESVDVLNYYADPPVDMTIKLNTRLSPADNAQANFKKYNKSKTALIKVKEQLGVTDHEIDYLENVLVNLENSIDANNLEDIRNELASQGYVKKKQKQKKKKHQHSKPFHYTSTDGMTILVGKNNTQNDELTLKFASKADMWLHTKIIPGSHVIIRTEGKAVSDETIEEAAILAALYSKAKTSNQVPVDYTLVKNVKKPNGAKPGMVIYETNSTVYVDPNSNKLQVNAAKK